MEAAASPKDVIILVDRSGSMTGQRRDIAKHVVTNILDTLGNNDFVNVLTFADDVEEIVPCFEDSLVQVLVYLVECIDSLFYVDFVFFLYNETEFYDRVFVPSHLDVK